MAGDGGIEPPQADPKSAALPLCKSPINNKKPADFHQRGGVHNIT